MSAQLVSQFIACESVGGRCVLRGSLSSAGGGGVRPRTGWRPPREQLGRAYDQGPLFHQTATTLPNDP